LVAHRATNLYRRRILRRLLKVGVISRVGQRQVRGAVQTFYFLTDRFDPAP